MEQTKYLVRLVRPVFQAAYLEVEASCESEACSIALASSYDLPEEQWTGRFNPEEHTLDLHCVRGSETREGHPFSLLDFPLYNILSTNENPHPQGKGIEIWMNFMNPLTVAGYLSQWIEELSDARVGFYEESIEELEEKLRDLRGSDQKVVPLLPPELVRGQVQYLESFLDLLCLLKDVD